MRICRIMMLGVLAMAMLTSCDEKKQSTTDSEVAAMILEGEDAKLAPYVGNWDLKVIGVPTMGDIDMTLALEVEEKEVTGKLKAMAMSIKLNNIRVEDEKLKFSLNFQNMDIPFSLELEGYSGLKGEMMNEFKVSGEKSK